MKMLKIKCLLLLAWLMSMPILAATLPSDEEVLFNAHWLKQEYQTYELRHQNYVLQQEDTTEQEQLSCLLDVVVRDSSYQSYHLEWRLYDFRIQGPHYLNTRWIESLKDFRLLYKVNQAGVLSTTSQVAEALHREMDKSIDELFAQMESVPALAARERLYALRGKLEEWILSSMQQFHQAYGRAYSLGQVVPVPEQMKMLHSPQAISVTQYKKLEDYRDDIATLVLATVPDSTIVNAQQQTLQVECSAAMMMHIPSGWPVYSYHHQEFGLPTWKEGILNEITLKQ